MTATLRSLLVLLALALPATAGAANTITVNPGDNVQAKVDSAADGDTVHFKAGTYTATVTTGKNNLTIEGEPGVFLVNPANATAATLTFTGSGAKLRDITVVSSVADAVVLGKDGTTIQRATLVSLKSNQAALSVVCSLGDAARTITVDSTVLAGPKSFSASYATGAVAGAGITALFRHVTAIGNVVADATNGVAATGITEMFSDSIIGGTPVAVNNPPTTATITADPARNHVGGTPAAVAGLFAAPGSSNYHLRADAIPAIDRGQMSGGESDKDVDGELRTSGPATDYGADEFFNKPPTASLAAPTGKVRQKIATTLDASKSSDPEAAIGGGIVTYHWDFGDGSKTDTTTPKTTHAFADRKTYTVTVTVSDKQGALSAASTQSITVVDGTPPTVSISQPLTKQRINLYKPKTSKRAKVTFFGKAGDDTLLDKVYLALRPVAVKNGKCRWFDTKTKLIAGTCKNPPVMIASVTGTTWRYSLPLKAKLAKGPYVLVAVSVDASGLPSVIKTVSFRFR